MMTMPRIISLTALAASLLIIIMTITQANGLSVLSGVAQPSGICLDAEAGDVMDCAASGAWMNR